MTDLEQVEVVAGAEIERRFRPERIDFLDLESARSNFKDLLGLVGNSWGQPFPFGYIKSSAGTECRLESGCITWKLRTSGQAMRRDVRVGECFRVLESHVNTVLSPTHGKAIVIPAVGTGSVSFGKSGRDWYVATQLAGYDVPIEFIPRWDADVAPEDTRFPHKCRCGSPAYFGATPAAFECSASGCRGWLP